MAEYTEQWSFRQQHLVEFESRNSGVDLVNLIDLMKVKTLQT